MDDCNWIEFTDNYKAPDGTLFTVGSQYTFDDIIVKQKEDIGCKVECLKQMPHYVVCYKEIIYHIPDDVAVLQPKGNTRPKDERDANGWRRKYRTDKSDWINLSKKYLGSFPEKHDADIDLRNYKKITGL